MRSGALVAVALLLASGVGAAAVLAPPPAPESLVEGHTVFSVLEQVRLDASNETEFAAAVAVLVRELLVTDHAFRFPGVLWLNDQYLVQPEESGGRSETLRYPCSGAVIAVNAGDPVPMRGAVASNDGATYVESYRIVDPNDHAWIVDRWNWTTGTLVVPLWTVALRGDETRMNETDDGTCDEPPFHDGGDTLPGIRIGGLDGRDPGDHGWDYPCGNVTAPCQPLRYNALLYFLLPDLRVDGGVKDHRENGTARNDDVSGCHGTTWPCPDADDDREGNSHAYNPALVGPLGTNEGGHGASAGGVEDVHATRRIDVRYGVAAPPTVDRVWRVTDGVGSTAPFHCHSGCGAVPAP